MKPDRERLALAILNSDRAAAGLPATASRDDIPNSYGYLRNVDAILSDIRAQGYRIVPEWQSIETAPYQMPVEVRVGHMTMAATLEPNASEDEHGSCDQWQAVHEGEHPPCWSEGACWASNIDEIESLQPSAWRHLNAETPNAEG